MQDNTARAVRFGLSVALLAAAPGPARAHFLFIRITPPAEGGRAAEVYFSERATAAIRGLSTKWPIPDFGGKRHPANLIDSTFAKPVTGCERTFLPAAAWRWSASANMAC